LPSILQQDLTKHLYRFLPAKFSEALNAHATNEKITLGAHLTTTRFFYEMVRHRALDRSSERTD
jgi:Gly-Xaa carboxypeptidase